MSFKDELEAESKTELASVAAHSVVIDYMSITQVSDDATIEEAEEIWIKLAKSLPYVNGYGLAAIQIGIPKRVALVVYKGQVYKMLNTKLVNGYNSCAMKDEGCLSIPGKTVNTERFLNITVEDDNLGKLMLSSKEDELLPIIFQHEIDHFNGITILDRQLKPFVKEYHYGRNDACPECGVKLKKCEHKDKYLI